MPVPGSIARKLTVSGRVQGVFYRDTCRREATARGVSGCAANRPDGTVEVFLEGPADAVEAVIDWCRQGPPHADVTDVQVDGVELRGITGFEITGT